jgi:diguanylate cyclase
MPPEPIELGLFKPDRPVAPADPRTLLPFIHELLELLADAAIESEALGTAAFRRELELYERRLQAAGDAKAFGRIASECAAYCHAFYEKVQAHVAERETEFTDVVRVVEQLVATVAGDAGRLDEQLAGSSERLTRIVQIDDLRILKRRLSLELTTLQRVIDEQRQQHEAQREQLAGEVDRLQRRLVRAREEALVDGLTRIPNRARFDRALRRWLAQHRVSGQPFAVAIVDVDDFKSVNDSCGHPEGDRVLCEVAALLSGSVRATDMVARYGGDEFAVLIAGIDVAQVEIRLRSALARLADLRVGAALADGLPRTVTASAGVTAWTLQDSAADLISRADRALYEAKAAGKGQLCSRLRPPKSKLFENGRPVAGALSPDRTAKAG